MQNSTTLFERLEERRLFSVSIGSITAVSHVPGMPADTIDRRAKATFTAPEVSASAGDSVSSVTYFLDSNADGVLDRGDRVIGRSRQAGKDFRVTRRIKEASGLGSEGTITISAVAHGRGSDDFSPVVTREITVVDADPTIHRLTASPRRPAAGGPLVIRAHGVAARGDGITNVEFFLDANGDSRIDAGDVNLGAGTRERPVVSVVNTGDQNFGGDGVIVVERRQRRHIWRFDASNVTAGAAAGESFTFLAQATDHAGELTSPDTPPTVTVTLR